MQLSPDWAEFEYNGAPVSFSCVVVLLFELSVAWYELVRVIWRLQRVDEQSAVHRDIRGLYVFALSFGVVSNPSL